MSEAARTDGAIPREKATDLLVNEGARVEVSHAARISCLTRPFHLYRLRTGEGTNSTTEQDREAS